jgi:arylsulfatase A-like enzyme
MSDVIAHSPMIEGHGQFPHRIVLRDLGDQFVVHTEVHEPEKKPWYCQGNYVQKRPDEHDAIRRAWKHFERRSRHALSLAPPPEETLKHVSDIAETIIKTLLPEDAEERNELIRDDYQLESDLETFEQLTGKSLYEKAAQSD